MIDGEIMDRLEIKIDNLREMFIEHQKRNDEQFAQFEKYFNLKIESDNCTSCSVVPKLEKIEKRIDAIDTWKSICVGAIIVLSFIAPYIMQKIFGVN